jgi:large subunit ribosomal protein L31
MQAAILPEIRTTSVECSFCGNAFETRSTVGALRLDVCSNCHPAYTGQIRATTSGSRIARFTRRYSRASARSAA